MVNLTDTSKERFARKYLASINRLNPEQSSIDTIVACLNSDDELYLPFKEIYTNWVAEVERINANVDAE